MANIHYESVAAFLSDYHPSEGWPKVVMNKYASELGYEVIILQLAPEESFALAYIHHESVTAMSGHVIINNDLNKLLEVYKEFK